MLKVGLVGVGGISGTHIPVWDKLPDTELVAICDIRPGQMEKYDGTRKYTSYEEMLEKEELDIVDICLPTYLHADYSIMAMEKKINVICEKPISLKAEDVERVYSTDEKNGVCFMIAHVLSFWPDYELIKELYDSKKYGKLISGSMERLGTYPGWTWDGWMTDEKRSGLVPYDLHIHDLDFLVYAFGAPEKTISHRMKLHDQDCFNCVYEYGDFFITAEAVWYATPYPFTANYRFQFENAIVERKQDKGVTVYERNGNTYKPEAEKNVEETGNAGIPKTNAYGNEIAYFVECVKAGKPADKVKPHELKTVINILNSI